MSLLLSSSNSVGVANKAFLKANIKILIIFTLLIFKSNAHPVFASDFVYLYKAYSQIMQSISLSSSDKNIFLPQGSNIFSSNTNFNTPSSYIQFVNLTCLGENKNYCPNLYNCIKNTYTQNTIDYELLISVTDNCINNNFIIPDSNKFYNGAYNLNTVKNLAQNQINQLGSNSIESIDNTNIATIQNISLYNTLTFNQHLFNLSNYINNSIEYNTIDNLLNLVGFESDNTYYYLNSPEICATLESCMEISEAYANIGANVFYNFSDIGYINLNSIQKRSTNKRSYTQYTSGSTGSISLGKKDFDDKVSNCNTDASVKKPRPNDHLPVYRINYLNESPGVACNYLNYLEGTMTTDDAIYTYAGSGKRLSEGLSKKFLRKFKCSISGYDKDEFPFGSTNEGVLNRLPKSDEPLHQIPKVSILCIIREQNSEDGRKLRAFYHRASPFEKYIDINNHDLGERHASLAPGEPFIVKLYADLMPDCSNVHQPSLSGVRAIYSNIDSFNYPPPYSNPTYN